MLTFECLVCAVVCVLIRVRQQTQFPVCFLDLTVRGSLFNRQNLIKIGWPAFSDSQDCRLLLGSV